MTRVAFIGLGAMGLPMAINVVRAGFEVAGFDPRQEQVQRLAQAGGHAARTARDAAANADVALAIPFDTAQLRDAILGPDGVLAGMNAEGIVVAMSTIGTADMRQLAHDVRERGCTLVDAPVTGGTQGAEAGTLTIIAAGPHAALDRAQPLLAPMSATVHRVGTEAGDAQFVKLLNQLLVGVHVVATTEVMAMAAAAGIDLERAYQVLCDGFGRSEIFAARVRSLLNGQLKTGGSLRIYLKDLPLALEAAGDLKVSTPTLASALQFMRLAAQLGFADADDAEVMARLMDRAD